MRSKTIDLSERRDSLSGGGIRVYHYKDEGMIDRQLDRQIIGQIDRLEK